jgi:hypothetical protein
VMAGLVDVDLEKARIVPVVRQQMALDCPVGCLGSAKAR